MSSIERVKPIRVEVRPLTIVGHNDSLARIVNGRELRKVRQKVRLSLANGHLWCLPGRWDAKTRKKGPDKWFISADGWDFINDMKIVSFAILPDTKIRRDERGQIRGVFMSMLGYGRTRVGDYASFPCQLDLNADDWFTESALKALQPFHKDNEPAPPPPTWIKIVDPKTYQPEEGWTLEGAIGGMRFAIKMNDPAAIKMLSGWDIKRSKILRTAQTMCRRNILARMLGIPKVAFPDSKGEFQVQVDKWIEDKLEQEAMERIAQQLTAGVRPEDALPKGARILAPEPVEEIADDKDFEEAMLDAAAQEAAMDGEYSEVSEELFNAEGREAAPTEPAPVDRKALVREVQRLCRTKPDDKLAAAVVKAGIPAVELLLDRDCAQIPNDKLAAFVIAVEG